MEKYTIQIIPHNEGKTKQITVSKRMLILLLTLLFIIVVSLLYFSLNIGLIYVSSIKYRMMEKKVERLENREKQIAYLSREIRKFYVLSDKLNRAMELNITPEDVHYENNQNIDSREEGEFNNLEINEEARRLLEFVPNIMPCSGGWISKVFTDEHKGIDISLKEGTSIYSTLEGEVTFSGSRQYFGKCIEIQNDEGFLIFYGHNDKNLVRKGDKVKKGDIVALSGNTGRSDAPHLHYGIKMHGKWVNPINYLPIGR